MRDFGVLRVRLGKAHRGSAKKVHSVLTVWPWTVDVIEDWIDRGLPRFGDPIDDIFPTGPGGLVSESHLLGRFRRLVEELGFPPGLDLHSFRRSYATQLVTGGALNTIFLSAEGDICPMQINLEFRSEHDENTPA